MSFPDGLRVISCNPRYGVTAEGEVWSCTSGSWQMMRKVESSGYHKVKLSSKGRQRMHSVHSLVMAAFVGVRPNGLVINHKDGDKLNNRVSNLEYCTYRENWLHALRTGLSRSIAVGIAIVAAAVYAVAQAGSCANGFFRSGDACTMVWEFDGLPKVHCTRNASMDGNRQFIACAYRQAPH